MVADLLDDGLSAEGTAVGVAAATEQPSPDAFVADYVTAPEGDGLVCFAEGFRADDTGLGRFELVLYDIFHSFHTHG